MKDKTDHINQIIVIAAGVVLALDLTAKVAGQLYLFMPIIKWLTTFFYPIVAGYVFLFANTFKASDVAFFRNPKSEKKLLFVIKYILFGTGILLLPSCLNYWFEFTPVLLRTLKMSVFVLFPLATLLLIIIGFKMKPSIGKTNEE
jgi:hypothetical protein